MPPEAEAELRVEAVSVPRPGSSEGAVFVRMRSVREAGLLATALTQFVADETMFERLPDREVWLSKGAVPERQCWVRHAHSRGKIDLDYFEPEDWHALVTAAANVSFGRARF